MRRLYILTAILVLLAQAIGCESCLTRGVRAQPAPTCVQPCEPGCATGCAAPNGCATCRYPWHGADARPGAVTLLALFKNSGQVHPGRFRHPERNRLGGTVLFFLAEVAGTLRVPSALLPQPHILQKLSASGGRHTPCACYFAEVTIDGMSTAPTRKLDLIATSTFGLEAVVARELESLGYETKIIQPGRILFTGDEFDICRTNLWLRTADRVAAAIGHL